MILESVKYFRDWRKHNGLTLKQLGMQIGVNDTVLSRIETGKHRCNTRILKLLAKAYHCKPADILAGPPIVPVVERPTIFLSHNENDLWFALDLRAHMDRLFMEVRP